MKQLNDKLRGGDLRYLAPEVSAVEIAVERGFAQSSSDVDYNTEWGDPSFTGSGDNNFDLD